MTGRRSIDRRHLDLAYLTRHRSLDLEVLLVNGHLDLTVRPLPNLLVWTYQLRTFQSTTMTQMPKLSTSQNLRFVNLRKNHTLMLLMSSVSRSTTMISNGLNNLSKMLPKKLVNLMFSQLFKKLKRPSLSALTLTWRPTVKERPWNEIPSSSSPRK